MAKPPEPNLITLARKQAAKGGLFRDISAEKKDFLAALQPDQTESTAPLKINQTSIQAAIKQCSHIKDKVWLNELSNITSDTPDYTLKLNPFVQPFQEHLLLTRLMAAATKKEQKKAAVDFAQYYMSNLAGKQIDIEAISQLLQRHSDINGLNDDAEHAQRQRLYAEIAKCAASKNPVIPVIDSRASEFQNRMPDIIKLSYELDKKPPIESSQRREPTRSTPSKDAYAEADDYSEVDAKESMQTSTLIVDSNPDVEEAIYGNAKQILAQKKPLGLLKEGSTINVLGSGNYGIVVQVELEDGRKCARKIDIKNAEKLTREISDDQRDALLRAFFNRSLSYENLETILASSLKEGDTDLRQKAVKDLIENPRKYGLKRNTSTSQTTEALSKEYQTLAMLGGTYFPEVHGYDADLHTYDMAIAEKGSLKSVLESRSDPLSPAQKMTLLAGVSQAVSYVVGHNMIHNDLHAGNLLVGKDFKVMIADPGSARFAGYAVANKAYQTGGRQRYMMHPDVFTKTDKGLSQKFDSIYNDTWAYVLLIGKIIKSDIRYQTKQTDLKDNGANTVFQLNLAAVTSAINASKELSSEAKAVLNTQIALLAPTNIPEIPADKARYAHREKLIAAMDMIQSTILNEKARLEKAASEQVEKDKTTIRDNPALNESALDSRLKSMKHEYVTGFSIAQQILALAKENLRKIDAGIVEKYLTPKLLQKPEMVSAALTELKKLLSEDKRLKELFGDDAQRTMLIPKAEPVPPLPPPRSPSAQPPKPVLRAYAIQPPPPLPPPDQAQRILSQKAIYDAIDGILFQPGFSDNCVAAICKIAQQQVKVREDVLRDAFAAKGTNQKLNQAQLNERVENIIATLKTKGLIEETCHPTPPKPK